MTQQRKPGRPRKYIKAQLVATRIDEDEKGEFFSERLPGETKTAYLLRMAEIGIKSMQRLKTGCKVIASGLLMIGAIEAEDAIAAPTPAPAPIEVMAEPTPEPPTPSGPDLWNPICSDMEKRVNEQNFEIWLSSVRFDSSTENKLSLLVPNLFFQDYLKDHYTEVIQEVLWDKHQKKFDIEFVVNPEPQEEPPPPPKPPPPKTEREQIREQIQKLSAEIPLPILQQDRTLLDLDTRIRQAELLNPVAIGVSNKLCELQNKYLDRLNQLHAKLPKVRSNPVPPKPRRNDRPWPRRE